MERIESLQELVGQTVTKVDESACNVVRLTTDKDKIYVLEVQTIHAPLNLMGIVPHVETVEDRPAKYSAWGDGEVANTFICGTELSESQRRAEPELQLMKVFEAHSWDDALRQYHEWQGWEPYVPMDDSEKSS